MRIGSYSQWHTSRCKFISKLSFSMATTEKLSMSERRVNQEHKASAHQFCLCTMCTPKYMIISSTMAYVASIDLK